MHCLAYGKMCTGCGKTRHFKKVYQSRRDRVVNELAIKESQECSDGENETMSINSVHLNKKLIITNGGTRDVISSNTLVIPYKIDTGSKGNIMPLFIFKKLFKNITEEQLKKTINSHIRLRTCNRTNITQLGMCTVLIKFKNIKKRCVFFVVQGHGSALIGIPDTAALKLINVNIDYIQAG